MISFIFVAEWISFFLYVAAILEKHDAVQFQRLRCLNGTKFSFPETTLELSDATTLWESGNNYSTDTTTIANSHTILIIL